MQDKKNIQLSTDKVKKEKGFVMEPFLHNLGDYVYGTEVKRLLIDIVEEILKKEGNDNENE